MSKRSRGLAGRGLAWVVVVVVGLSMTEWGGLAPLGARGAEERGLAASLEPFVAKGSLAGAVVLVGSPEGVLDLEAVGYSDLAARTPMKTDALFWIASMSKPLTATALMMLVDEGKIALDDPVEKYLPEFRGQKLVVATGGDLVVLKSPSRPITVRDVLSHTAGLVGRSPIEGALDTLSLREAAITYGLSPLQFDPGSKYQYCNPGINTAGRLIEVVSGTPYEEFLDRRLLGPLGMTDTTLWPSEAQVKRLAKSYKPGPPGSGSGSGSGLVETPITQLTYPLTDRSRRPYPAGGYFSTASDLARFCRMILDGGTFEGRRYVSEASVRAMTSTQTGGVPAPSQGGAVPSYGLGWSTSRKAPRDSGTPGPGPGPVIPGPCGHGGAYATSMKIDPERRRITIFLVQHAGFPNGDGPRIEPAFLKAARDRFPK